MSTSFDEDCSFDRPFNNPTFSIIYIPEWKSELKGMFQLKGIKSKIKYSIKIKCRNKSDRYKNLYFYKSFAVYTSSTNIL